jgi:hypothetical protein
MPVLIHSSSETATELDPPGRERARFVAARNISLSRTLRCYLRKTKSMR